MYTDELVTKHQSALLGYVYGFTKDYHDAQEVVQETFLRLIEKPPPNFDGITSWLFKVARNLCIDRGKRKSRYEKIIVKHESTIQIVDFREKLNPFNNALALERWEQIIETLNQLPENQKWVILLFFQQGMLYREIAEVTGLSMSSVGMLLNRGLKALKPILAANRDLMDDFQQRKLS